MEKKGKKMSTFLCFFCPLKVLRGGGQSLADMSAKMSSFLLTPLLFVNEKIERFYDWYSAF